MFSLMSKIESVARAIAFLCHFFMIAVFLVLQALTKPLLPHIDSICDNYFSRNFKEKCVHEYICKKFAIGMFEVFGIRVLSEFKVKLPFNIPNLRPN